MKKRIFIAAGIFLFVLWLIDIILKLRLYGEYEYLWFCSISALLLSIAYIFNNRTLIISFLPIAIEGQVIWIMDYFFLVFSLPTITQNSNYMFDYGQTFLEFIIGLKHLFIIPLAFLGLVYIKKPINKYAWIFTIIIGILIMIISPFIPGNNINCTSYSCLNTNTDKFSLAYSVNFFIFSFILCIFLLYIPIYFVIKKSNSNPKYKKFLNIFIICLFIIALAGVFLGFLKYYKIPHYNCLNKDKNLICEKAFSENLSSAYFSYHMINSKNKKCNISAYSLDGILLGNQERIVYREISKGYIDVPIPEKDTNVFLLVKCEDI